MLFDSLSILDEALQTPFNPCERTCWPSNFPRDTWRLQKRKTSAKPSRASSMGAKPRSENMPQTEIFTATAPGSRTPQRGAKSRFKANNLNTRLTQKAKHPHLCRFPPQPCRLQGKHFKRGGKEGLREDGRGEHETATCVLLQNRKGGCLCQVQGPFMGRP